MDRPILCALIVILWVIGLMGFLIFNRYEIQYDRAGQSAIILDKWKGTVQAYAVSNPKAVRISPDKAPALGKRAENHLNPKEQEIPDVIEGLQNKEP